MTTLTHRWDVTPGGGLVGLAQGPARGAVGFGAGGALVLWIAAQLLVLQRYFFLQPVIGVLGAIEMALAWWWVHRSLQA